MKKIFAVAILTILLTGCAAIRALYPPRQVAYDVLSERVDLVEVVVNDFRSCVRVEVLHGTNTYVRYSFTMRGVIKKLKFDYEIKKNAKLSLEQIGEIKECLKNIAKKASKYRSEYVKGDLVAYLERNSLHADFVMMPISQISIWGDSEKPWQFNSFKDAREELDLLLKE